MAEVDDGVRGEVGLLVSITELEPSKVRLVFDRVRREGTQWKSIEFSTFRDLPKEVLLQMSMSDDDLHSFGLVMTAELAALLETSGK